MTLTRQPDIRERIAEALAARVNGVASDGRGWFRTEDERQRYLADADAVLAAVQPDFAERDAELDRLRTSLFIVRTFADRDQDGATCPHNVTGQLRRILGTLPASAPSLEG